MTGRDGGGTDKLDTCVTQEMAEGGVHEGDEGDRVSGQRSAISGKRKGERGKWDKSPRAAVDKLKAELVYGGT